MSFVYLTKINQLIDYSDVWITANNLHFMLEIRIMHYALNIDDKLFSWSVEKLPHPTIICYL